MEKKPLFRKGIAVVVILLFIGMSIVPSTGTTVEEKSTMSSSYDGNTLYVGGSGEGNYSKIQDAIDNASDGDTVFVYDDSSPYYENVIVDKSINLIGENKNTTIIDGGESSDVVDIFADWVTISGFTIQNSEEAGDYYAGIKIYSYYNKISDCNINIFSYSSFGVWVWSSHNNNISNCNISNFGILGYGIWIDWHSMGNNIYNSNISESDRGIMISYSSNNTVSNCNIQNNEVGIRLDYSSYITISNNIIDSNNWGGIHVYNSSDNNISGNNITNNRIGINLDGSSNNIIDENIVTLNNHAGLWIVGSSNNITITNNTVFGNSWQGILIADSCNNSVLYNTMSENGDGIVLVSADNIAVEDNLVTSNDCVGIQLVNSEGSVVFNNRVMNQTGIGITLHESNDNTIQNNRVVHNQEEGVLLTFSNCNRIEANEAVENGGNGIRLHNSSYNEVSHNNASIDDTGIVLENFSNNNTISGNNVAGNYNGILVGYSSNNNAIYHNNFLHNTVQVVHITSGCVNVWDNGYPSCGNYWSDYSGVDNYSGPNQDITGPDGIGDSPYNITGGSNQDRYPLMEPYGMTELDMDISKILFGFSVIIKNVGETTAYNAQWKITIQGGILLRINKTVSGTIPTPILAGEQSIVKSGLIFIFGFGRIMITVSAWADNAPMVTKTNPGFLLLFFVILT